MRPAVARASQYDAMADDSLKKKHRGQTDFIGVSFRPRTVNPRSIFLRKRRAGRGNRTLIASLEDWSFTTKLYPRGFRSFI